MKGLLLIILFLLIVPLLIGRLAGLYSKSKSDLVQLATVAGILILFTFYLLFIHDKGAKNKQATKPQPPPSSEKPVDCYAPCVYDDYPMYRQERREQHVHSSEVQFCDPAMEYPPY